ncbi:class II aldolase/adducin family protein [Solibacillus sp. FSL W7-1464]|uniref:class II aldolase/adducin family protein n=1 Tax=Solibacillus sp. FSL W7-1464 TaxID=2921706 RepID=UPI0030F7A432
MSRIIADLKHYANELVTSGLVVGAGGNLSMRDDEYMYISPSGFDLKEIKDNQWVKVHIDSGEIEGELRPSSEVLMHLECFRKRPDINACLHAHPTFSVAVSSTGNEIPALFPDFPAMIKKVGYIDYVVPTTSLLANKVAEQIEDTSVLVFRNHGVLTVGRTMKEAFFFMQLTEESAKVFTFSKIIGSPRILTEEECDELRNLSAERYRANLLEK